MVWRKTKAYHGMTVIDKETMEYSGLLISISRAYQLSSKEFLQPALAAGSQCTSRDHYCWEKSPDGLNATGSIADFQTFITTASKADQELVIQPAMQILADVALVRSALGTDKC